MVASFVGDRVARRALVLSAIAPAKQASLIDLSAEFPSGSTPITVRAAAVDAIEQHQCDHYARRPGIAPLCRAVADVLATEGVNVGEAGVVISGSVAEARYVAVRALAAGKSVFQPSPAPTIYAAALDFGGATAHVFDPGGDLPAAASGLLLFANPNPVTGQVIDVATLERLAIWVETADLLVIADESAGLLRPEAPFVRFAALPAMSARTLTVGSFAGTPGLAAWQVSWFAGPKAVLTPVRDLKQSITICTSAASQYAALATATIEDAGDVLAQSIERLEAIIAVLEIHALPYWAPDTAAYVVADVRSLGGSDAVTAACAAAGVLVGNGEHLGNPGTVRIGLPAGALGDALERLDTALTQASGG